MKLNLGCGNNKKQGFVNVDMFAECEPDELCDIEQLPWPWKTSSVTEVLFNHALEHVGGDPKIFLGIMQELYRVGANGCIVQINVPHPRHDNFLDDPTHVRPVTPQMLSLFSKDINAKVKAAGGSNTPFAQYLNVDFETTNVVVNLDEPYARLFEEKKISQEQMMHLIKEKNNVVKEYQITLKVIK